MTQFKYTALTEVGEKVSGVLEAETEADLEAIQKEVKGAVERDIHRLGK